MYCEISQWSKDTRLKHYVTQSYVYEVTTCHTIIWKWKYYENIIKIGKKCIDYGVEEVLISSIFWKKVLDLVPL